MSEKSNTVKGMVVFAVVVIVTVAVTLFLVSVVERRDEAAVQTILKPVEEWETDNAVWGENYPREYATYVKMKDDTTRTKYGGADPRDYLEETPANVVLFAGYGFAKEYRQARGHYYAVQDAWDTARTGDSSPATCWTCKSPDVPRMMNEMGVDEFYAANFADLKDEIKNPIGCGDCHDSKTMALTITRPALIEAYERAGVKIEDVSHQEMRSLVCAQCHVEYYFKPKGESKYLTFPWDKGQNLEDMEEYYNELEFKDWEHAISGAPMVKMQHPDFELYKTGIHAYMNISCSDCHMPYHTEGAAKFTDHHVQSPLLNIKNSCAVCHRWGEEEIRSRVESIQTKVREGRDRAERAIALAHLDIAACDQAGANDDELLEVRKLVRAAQIRWDYVAANNGMGFHSPQEAMRLLGAAVDTAQECRIQASKIMAKYGYATVNYPELDTKDKVMALIKSFIDKNPPNLLGEQL